MLRRWLDAILSLLFVHKCFLCEEVVAAEAFLCPNCENQLPLVQGDTLCPRCGKHWGDCICGELEENAYDWATVPLFYTHEVAHGIHKFKYSDRTYYAQFLAPLMAAQFLRAFPEAQIDHVTWVPMHPKKQRARGYCQSELLAKQVCALLNLPEAEVLLRNTGLGGIQMEQKGLSARRENAIRSYEALAEDGSLTGCNVLLVDDVLTTGSTAARCSALLHALGAHEVYLLAAATTIRRGRKIDA